ncbi:MAG: flagellar hook basal-body protein [Planctomycetes bacterium]|nr:flagellar hook basal-body protein [Planctomycetota bacterium]
MTNYSESILIRGLSYLAERQAAIANNLANVDTSSYKRRVAYAEQTGHDFRTLLDQQLPSIDFREQTDFGRGISRETGNRFDVAIDGDFWLRVQNADGENFYTRNGQLQIDKDGFLVSRDGLRLLDQGLQPIQLGAGDAAPAELTISPNGSIQDPVSGQTWGPLSLVTLDDDHALQPIGRGLYRDPTGQVGRPAGDGLQQGFLEGSNVDALQELVAMITVERSFAATQKALTSSSRLQENIITNILR